MSRQTGGEWQAVVVKGFELPKGDYIAVNNGTSTVIAVCGRAGAGDEAESIANAQLISSAQKLQELVATAHKACGDLLAAFACTIKGWEEAEALLPSNFLDLQAAIRECTAVDAKLKAVIDSTQGEDQPAGKGGDQVEKSWRVELVVEKPNGREEQHTYRVKAGEAWSAEEQAHAQAVAAGVVNEREDEVRFITTEDPGNGGEVPQ